MAEAKISVSPDQFICSVCQDRLKDPVTTTCGHNYCKQCIEEYWDTTENFICPQCRTIFVLRPVLHRNTVLAEVIEELNKTNPVDVPCDVCTGTKARAVKTCLTCQASFCKTHIEPHRVSEALRKHKLEVPLPNLNERLCSKHQKALEVYCRTDQTCICSLCAVTEHKSHDTVTPNTERQERQAQVLTSRQDVKEKMQNKRKTLEKVTVMEAQVKITAEKEVQEYEETFDLLLQSIGELKSNVISMIKKHEEIKLGKVAEVKNRLEKEIKELERKDTELEVISQTDDDIYFLQNVQSLCIPSESESTPIIAAKEHFFSEILRQNLLKVNESLKEINCSEFVKTRETVMKKESKVAAFLNWIPRPFRPSDKVIEVVGSVRPNIAEETFLNELSEKLMDYFIIIQKAQLDNESRNLVLLFCPVVSRIGTDIAVALKKVSNNKKIILVVMHHTPNPDYVVADSSRFMDQENVVLTVDCLFHETTGLLNCNLNKESSQKVCYFIYSFI